jgi:hypothetical protein
MYLLTDGTIILLSALIYQNIENGIYAALCLAVSAWTADSLIRGFNRANVFHIILDSDPEPLAKAIMRELDRGVTLQKATGMYARGEKSVLVVVVKPREVYRVKDLIKKYAPTAFAYLSPAAEWWGRASTFSARTNKGPRRNAMFRRGPSLILQRRAFRSLHEGSTYRPEGEQALSVILRERAHRPPRGSGIEVCLPEGAKRGEGAVPPEAERKG